MVSVGIGATGDGRATDPHFAPPKQTVNATYYSQNTTDASPLIQIQEQSAERPPRPARKWRQKPCFPQEDGAPAHTAATTREYMTQLEIHCLGGDAG